MELIKKRMIEMNKNRKGFTLIEVVLAIALLAIISIVFLTLFSSGMLNIANAGKSSVLNNSAQENLEKIIADPLNASGSSVSNNTTLDIVFSGVTYSVPGRKIDVPASGTHILTTFTTN
jgi:prepilin-type N-terminal cleavage/methylation domain-containing protein